MIGSQTCGVPIADQISAAIANVCQVQYVTAYISSRQSCTDRSRAQLLCLLIDLQVCGLNAALQRFRNRSAILGGQRASERFQRQKAGDSSMSIPSHAVGYCEEQTGCISLFASRYVDGILVVIAHRPDDTQTATFNFRKILSQSNLALIPGCASPSKNIGKVHGLQPCKIVVPRTTQLSKASRRAVWPVEID